MFDFARRRIARAAELCAGVGECRKLRGNHVSSFQATREEQHSTRAVPRAPALVDGTNGPTATN